MYDGRKVCDPQFAGGTADHRLNKASQQLKKASIFYNNEECELY